MIFYEPISFETIMTIEKQMLRILVVDDDKSITAMLRQLFVRQGFEVDVADDGRLAIKLLEQNVADLVVTDIIMPGMEGAEFIMKLKRLHPDVKIIAISGGGRIKPKDYLILAGKLGADKTFAKPVMQKEMLAAVKELLPFSH